MAQAVHSSQYGNLMSYKYYTRPKAYEVYGSFSKIKTKHQMGMQEVLRLMFENGPCTTWDIAKLKLNTKDVAMIREKEKHYRRLFLGRYDTKKKTGGMLDLGLVVRKKAGPYSKYRLSLHGILYCTDVMNPSNDSFDRMAKMYADVLPKVFGRWEEIKAIAGPDAYKIRVLAKGLLLNNNPDTMEAQSGTPLYELMLFVHAKYAKRFESIAEAELAEQVSYWFYTFLLYYEGIGPHAKSAKARINKMKKMMRQDRELFDWYGGFLVQASDYYKDRLHAMEKNAKWAH